MTDVRTALRWGAWVFAGMTLLVFYRSPALDVAVRFGHPEIQRAAYLTSVGCWATTVLLLPAGDRWPRLRRSLTAVLIALTLVATAAATVTLPAGQQHTSTSWAVATNGWLLLAICAGSRTAVVVVLLAIPLLLAMLCAVPGGTGEIVLMTARTLGILGLQVPVALATRALQRSADAANALLLQQEAIRTEQVVADTLLADRLRRSQAVATVAQPVLALLAEPASASASVPASASAAPAAGDDGVRRRCGAAAAQVRRLLAEWHRGGPDPLGDDLTACLDQIQAAGLRVDVAVHTATPDAELPAPLRSAACDIVRGLAADSVTRLRVTILSTTKDARLAIVAHAGAGADLARHRPGLLPAPLTVRTTTASDSLWVELTCPL